MINDKWKNILPCIDRYKKKEKQIKVAKRFFEDYYMTYFIKTN